MSTTYTYEKRSPSLLVRRPKPPKEETKDDDAWFPCGYCGSTAGYLSGNEVCPGYDGYPICASCQGV